MAGLLPRLKKGAMKGSDNWIYLDPIVPGTDPIESLTIALARLMKDKSQKAIRENLLDCNTRELHVLTREIADKAVVLYIDQFEEIFTLVNDEAERRQFLDLLTTAITEPNGKLVVILTMRADFYNRPAQYKEFGDLIQAHHVLMTPIGLADLYDVMQKPAHVSGLVFDDGLVTQMVFAVREEAGALPLLQFTLDQLFEKRDGRTLTLQAYTEMGGVLGTLAQHAEATYNSLPSEQHKTLALALFLRLIEAGATEQDITRRRATNNELTLPDVEDTRILQETADAFIYARLLVSDKKGEERTLEVSHEALIREWRRLGEWLHKAREDLRIQRNLANDVTRWKNLGQPETLLYRGVLLDIAEDWVSRNRYASYDEVTFLKASRYEEIARQTSLIALEKEREVSKLTNRFMPVVFHDLRNPLAMMQSKLDMLSRYSDRMSEEKRKEIINGALSQIQTLKKLMLNVFIVIRLQTKDGSIHLSEHELVEFCKHTVKKFEEDMQTNHTVHCEFSFDSLYISFDSELLQHALNNLLLNAVRPRPMEVQFTLC
jgi:signal transduction histidine kinase